MTLEIIEAPEQSELYAGVIAKSDHALLYHSPVYRRFLRRLMPDSQARSLIALQDGVPTAALPSMTRSGPYGTVVNSLPFYGSHGGVVSTPDASPTARTALMDAFHERNRGDGVTWATVISNPLTDDFPVLSQRKPDFRDERIGQFTPLPEGSSREAVFDSILAQCRQRHRTTVRKSLKSGYRISHDGSAEAMAELGVIHAQNMNAIGGLAKGPDVFSAIRDTFAYDSDYRVYRADTADGDCASMLLVFYYREFVEYFTPCTVDRYRNDQPLSALVITAMADAVVERASRWWNWGGTWLSQDGVYQYKSRWGAIDRPYHYLIWSYPGSPEPSTLDPQMLKMEYPYFYTLPYQALES
jgi:hypothetical protein